MTENIAYLSVFNAHNGELVRIPKPVRFHTLPELKAHLLQHFTNYIIASEENIFLLTPFGIKLDYLMVNEMTEIYLFDRRLFSSRADRDILDRYLLQAEDANLALLVPKKYAATAADSRNVASALKIYDGWAKGLLQDCQHMEEYSERLVRHINAIFKALNIIFQFAANFVGSAEKSFTSYFNYVKLLSMKSLHRQWRECYRELKKLPKVHLKNATQPIDLSALIQEEALSVAAQYVGKYLPPVTEKFNDFSASVNSINQEKIQVDLAIEALRKESVTKFKHYEELKVKTSQEVAELGNSIRDDMLKVDTVSKKDLSAIYSRQLNSAESLYSKASSMYGFLQTLHEFKRKLAWDCLRIFESIANLQMKAVQVKADSKSLMSPSDNQKPSGDDFNHNTVSKIKEAEDFLSMTIDLPLLFGFVIVEKRRQYEWYDFYSKGIVNNVSEQLTIIIENEKVFQKLWIRKFGNFVKHLNSQGTMRIQLPSIDVTLVNGDASAGRRDSIFAFLGDVHVERSDITSYIETLKEFDFKNNKKFSGLLEKNFKDLVVSTDSMKNVTKVATSLSSFANPPSELRITRNGQDVEQDIDLNVIKGLRSRIKKLEDLLHQQQYKNLTNWPVVKNSKASDHRQSMILKPNFSTSAVPTRTTSLPTADPILLLQRSRSVLKDVENGMGASKVLDASTTIDKHLDNIRLRRENSDLNSSIDRLVKERKLLQATISTLQHNLDASEREKRAEKQDFEEKYLITQKTIEDLGARHEEELRSLDEKRTQEIEFLVAKQMSMEAEMAQLKKTIADQASERSQAELEAKSTENEVSDLAAKLGDLRMVNTELLSNMHAKEAEFVNERKELEKEIGSLRHDLEEKSEDFENLMDVVQHKQQRSDAILASLKNVIQHLFADSEKLLRLLYDYFEEMCRILESMGLLLVKEASSSPVGEFKIRRVKGLRAKKGEEEDDMTELKLVRGLHSEVVQDIASALSWIPQLNEELARFDLPTSNLRKMPTNEPDPLEVTANHLIELFEKHFLDEGKVSNFTKFMQTIAFRGDAGRPEDAAPHSFFYNGISKRFNDVEGFAKKLTKENKVKTLELSRALKALKNKISVKNFQEGDLVLFLPTRLEVGADGSRATPWTAFNIDAPHYFLDMSSQEDLREWIVSRIASITEHVVTEASSAGENPYGLSVGLTWYMIKSA